MIFVYSHCIFMYFMFCSVFYTSGGASPRPTFKLAKINLMTARTSNIQDANAFNVSGN